MAEIVVKLTLRPVVMFLIEKGERRSALDSAACRTTIRHAPIERKYASALNAVW